MEPWVRAFLILLGGLALLIQPAPFLNDEVGQVAGLTVLSEGDLLIDADLPPGYDDIRGWSTNVIPRPGASPMPNAGSNMLNILALPVLGVLHLLEFAVGPMGASGLVVAALIGFGWWAWRGDRWEAAAVASTVAFGAAVMQVRYSPLSSPYLEAAAIQLVSMAFLACGAALLYDLLRTRVSRPALGTALYAFGTPALFWGLNLKYHSIAINLTMVCIWLYQEGHRTKPLRTALAFAVAGLALWNHLPNGLLTFAGLAVMAAPAVLLGVVPLAKRAGAGIAGIAVGFVPEIWDQMAHAAVGVGDRFIQVGSGAVGSQIAGQNEGGRLRWAIWNDPGGPLDAFFQMFIWPDPTTPAIGTVLPVLALVPAVVLILWAWRPGVEKVGLPLMVWGAVHFVVLLALFGRGVFLNGAGFDLRQASTLWPFIVLWLAPIIDSVGVRVRDILRAGGAVTAVMAVTIWIPFFIAREQKGFSALIQGPLYDLLQPLRIGGVLLATGIFLVWVVPRLAAWRRPAAAAGLAWAFMVQFILQMGPARVKAEGLSFPFIAWPTALLEMVVERFLYYTP